MSMQQRANLDKIYESQQLEPETKKPHRDLDDTLEENQHMIAFQERVRQNMRLRLQYFCYHIKWITNNIVNLQTLGSRKDLVSFGTKEVEKLESYANSILRSKFTNFDHTIIRDKQVAYMAYIKKLLHALESVAAREYVAPVLSVDYLKHIQGMAGTLLEPHWALVPQSMSEDDQQQSIVLEISQFVLPVYFNLCALIKLLHFDYHNHQFYSCMTLIQKYHQISKITSGFYEHYVPFLKDVLSLIDTVQQMVQTSSSNLVIPIFVVKLWGHETRLSLDAFELYKSEL